MRFDNEKFKKDVMTHRRVTLDISMDQAAKQIGVSKATISRAEAAKDPDINTFGLIVAWLGKQPNDYFTK
jgi:predicted transcriptional regulator